MKFPSSRERFFRHRAAWFFAAVLALLAAWTGTAGREWSECYHHDELAIRRWMALVRDEGYLTNRAYPNGWFQLYRIRMACQARAAKVSAAWREHVRQDGRVVAIDPESCCTPAVPAGGKPEPTIQDGRDFNSWLYVLTALFLFAACLEADFHPAAAFVSGLFFLASPASAEFVRYCETDAALLVSMAFFAWTAARAIRKGGAWRVLPAAFAAGFAVACKFTLFPLVLWCLAGPAVTLRRRDGVSRARRWGLFAALVLAALLALAAGYALGTPALVRAPAWYFAALRSASRRTYAELTHNLGGFYSWRAATVLRCRSLLGIFAGMGVLPLLWSLLSWSFWFRRPFRRQLAGIPGLLPLFVPFLVCCCPFVRTQEALPFDLLFAMGAGLPLQWLVFSRASRPPLRFAGKLAVPAAALLAVAAFAVQGARASGMASCFTVRDTRAEAQNWLHDSWPAGEPLFLDSYLEPVAFGVPCRAIPHGGFPYLWRGEAPESGGTTSRYYVENTGFEGRDPIRDAKTGALLPEVRRNLAAWNADVVPLRAWSVSRTTPRPTFGQPRVRLVAFERPSEGAPDVPVGFERPVRLLPYGASLYDAAGEPHLGPQRAVRTVGRRTKVFLDPANGSRWLVTRMLEGGGSVRIAREGLFSPAKSPLPAGGAVAAALAPSFAERLAARASALSSSRVRMRGGDDQALFCASFLAASPAEAARTLRLAGDPAAALSLLRAAFPLDDEGKVEAFLAAAAARVPGEPGWTEAARNALAAADRLAARAGDIGRTGAALCGVPAGIAADFARLRTNPRTWSPGESLPAWLPPGRYAVSFAVKEKAASGIPPRLFAGQTEDFAVSSVPGDAGRVAFSAAVDVREGQIPRLLGEPDAALPLFEPFEADIEIAWSPVERTLAAAETLRAALATGENP